MRMAKDAGTDTAVVRDLIAKDGTGHCIHDEPDVSFDSADFDIGFISSKHFSGSSSHSDLQKVSRRWRQFCSSWQPADGRWQPMDIFKGLCSFAEG